MRRFLIMMLFLVTSKVLAQSDEFKPGWYYDKSGLKISGLLSTSEILSHLKYKSAPELLTIKVKLSKIKGFVIGSDSFAVVRNFKVEKDWDTSHGFDSGVGRVLEVGKVILYEVYYKGENLYRHTHVPSTGASPVPSVRSTIEQEGEHHYVYVVQQNGTDKAIAVEADIDDFILQMTTYFKMNPELCERIRKREFSYSKAEQLVKEFNEWHRNK